MKTMTPASNSAAPVVWHIEGTPRDDVIKAQDRHLSGAVRSGDSSHQDAHETMRGRWRNPIKGMGWYRDTKKAYAALPRA